jgi:hypothetical protein
MDLLEELEEWLEQERKDYKCGAVCSISESIYGEGTITTVQEKIAQLKLKYAKKDGQ